MSTLPITEELIRQLDLAPRIYERGVDYYTGGMVLDVVQRGNMIAAQVEGSEGDPYDVQITLNTREIAATDCSCPYTEEWGGVCKHVVATLLVCAHQAEDIRQRPPIAGLLADLDAGQLRAILVQLAGQSGIANRVEALVDAARKKRG